MKKEDTSSQNTSILDLHLEMALAPINAEDVAKEKGEWSVEIVPGIKVVIWYAKDEKPFFVYQGVDKADGLKYGFCLLFKADYHYHEDHYKIQRLNETVARIMKENEALEDQWANYFFTELNKNAEMEKSETVFIAMTTKQCFVWTTNRQEFSLLLSLVSKAIRDLAKKSNLKEIQATTKEKYYDFANNTLPTVLGNGIEYAIDTYQQLDITSAEIGIIVDVEKSALLFTKEFGVKEDLRDEEVFYTYENEDIKTGDKWCTELGLNNSQEACHWLTDAIHLIDKRYNIFQNIDHITIYGNYMFGDEGEMDVIFQK